MDFKNIISYEKRKMSKKTSKKKKKKKNWRLKRKSSTEGLKGSSRSQIATYLEKVEKIGTPSLFKKIKNLFFSKNFFFEKKKLRKIFFQKNNL
jgi:hypothetical protein